MDRVSRLSRVVPSAATFVSGLVVFMTVAAHSKSGDTRIYTKFHRAPSRARARFGYCGSGIPLSPTGDSCAACAPAPMRFGATHTAAGRQKTLAFLPKQESVFTRHPLPVLIAHD